MLRKTLGFIKDLISKAAKAVFVALFPPIVPVIVLQELVQESGVYAKNQERSTKDKLIYSL
jgi:hypothetical protein